ncbi:MAG TPA: hypothetical protein VI452_01560 [Marmoricola sp.]
MATLVRLAVALALTATTCLGLALGTTGPALAAGSGCTGQGVDVVVDYGDLGGGVARGCAPHAAGQSGDKAFDAAGYPLQYVPDQPGFVCAVGHKPAQCKMPGSGDPWWGLFFSNGRSGSWKMAPVAVTKLKVPEGGAVAMVWESGKKVAKPAVTAPTVADRTGASTKQTAARPAASDRQQSGDGGSGVPVWVPIVVVVLLLAGGGAVAMRRRGTAS